MTPFLKLSNNGHAEVLTKEIGRVISGSGTWSAGLTAISEYVADTGMDTGTLRQRDGSGLSRRNLIPAAEFVDLLAAVRAEPWFDDLVRGPADRRQPERFVGGTLRSRMAGTPAAGNVHAKTGSLTGVSGLSGYVTERRRPTAGVLHPAEQLPDVVGEGAGGPDRHRAGRVHARMARRRRGWRRRRCRRRRGPRRASSAPGSSRSPAELWPGGADTASRPRRALTPDGPVGGPPPSGHHAR